MFIRKNPYLINHFKSFNPNQEIDGVRIMKDQSQCKYLKTEFTLIEKTLNILQLGAKKYKQDQFIKQKQQNIMIGQCYWCKKDQTNKELQKLMKKGQQSMFKKCNECSKLICQFCIKNCYKCKEIFCPLCTSIQYGVTVDNHLETDVTVCTKCEN